MLNEKFSRSEEAAIRRIIRKELDRSEKDIQKSMPVSYTHLRAHET